jgi:hypothetical protein
MKLYFTPYTAFLSQQGFTEHSIYLQLRFLNDMNQWFTDAFLPQRQLMYCVYDIPRSAATPSPCFNKADLTL